eukprot:2709762-Rhodomonas_salina.2
MEAQQIIAAHTLSQLVLGTPSPLLILSRSLSASFPPPSLQARSRGLRATTPANSESANSANSANSRARALSVQCRTRVPRMRAPADRAAWLLCHVICTMQLCLFNPATLSVAESESDSFQS